ncbi:MAG: hypothetical protein R3F50_04125 [Gammaproteobacteria bacterium]
MTRKISRLLDMVLTSAGVLAVLASVFFTNQMGQQVQFEIVVIGLMCAGAGSYGAALRLLPRERKYIALRQEGDRMIALIRRLHRSALAIRNCDDDRGDFKGILLEMHEAVRQMAKIAALEDHPVPDSAETTSNAGNVVDVKASVSSS